jgi:hypothetical protein
MIADVMHEQPPSLEPLYDARRRALAQLERCSQELAQDRALAARHHEALEAAMDAEEAASIVAAPQKAQARRDAQAVSDAANRQAAAKLGEHARLSLASQVAEGEVARAVDAILEAEALAIAADIERQHAALLRLGERLRGFLPPGTVSIGFSPPPIIAKALALVPALDSMHVPVHLLQAGAQPADFASVAARRAALIAGDATANDHSAA